MRMWRNDRNRLSDVHAYWRGARRKPGDSRPSRTFRVQTDDLIQGGKRPVHGDSFGVTFTTDVTPEEFQALWGGPRYVIRLRRRHSWWQRFLIRLGF